MIPLGDLWDVVAHGDEAFTDVMRVNFENAKRLYQNKLLPMLEQQHEIDLEVDRETGQDEPRDRREDSSGSRTTTGWSRACCCPPWSTGSRHSRT